MTNNSLDVWIEIVKKQQFHIFLFFSFICLIILFAWCRANVETDNVFVDMCAEQVPDHHCDRFHCSPDDERTSKIFNSSSQYRNGDKYFRWFLISAHTAPSSSMCRQNIHRWKWWRSMKMKCRVMSSKWKMKTKSQRNHFVFLSRFFFFLLSFASHSFRRNNQHTMPSTETERNRNCW